MNKLKLMLLALVACLTVASQVKAGPGDCEDSDFEAFAFEQLTVSTTALGLTAATYAPDGRGPAELAQVSVDTADVRFRFDGIVPTASIGDRAAAATAFNVCGERLIRRIRFIREDAADSVLNVHYLRRRH